MKNLKIYAGTLLALCLLIATAAAATNNLPLPNIVGSNGKVAPQILSSDPQIAACNFNSTGAVVTETTLTTFASTSNYPCINLRGAIEVTSSTGFITLQRNGLYRVNFSANCTGVTAETGRVTAMVSTDGGVTFAQILGADARTLFLTGTLQHALSGSGYLTVASTSANLAADQIVVALQGSTSGGGDMTCANGGGLRVERVDQAQPATYP